MSPLRAIRESLRQIPQAKEFSSQAGFACLIRRSESLVRAIEGQRTKVSTKLAEELEAQFKVPAAWFMQDSVSKADTPNFDLGFLNDDGLMVDASTSRTSAIAGKEGFEKRIKPGPWFEPDPRRRFRKKLIASVMIAMDDLFSACSDEELALVTSELRESMYSRLAEIAKAGDSRDT
jgi:hypothetical protein